MPEHDPTNPYLQPLSDDPSDRDELPNVVPGASTEEASWDKLEAETAEELFERSDPRGRKAKPVVSPKLPGLTGTVNDYSNLLVILEEQVSREHDDWPRWKVVAEAETRYDAMVAERHPKFVEKYVEIMQCLWTPNRRFIRENIQVAACRRVCADEAWDLGLTKIKPVTPKVAVERARQRAA